MDQTEHMPLPFFPPPTKTAKNPTSPRRLALPWTKRILLPFFPSEFKEREKMRKKKRGGVFERISLMTMIRARRKPEKRKEERKKRKNPPPFSPPLPARAKSKRKISPLSLSLFHPLLTLDGMRLGWGGKGGEGVRKERKFRCVSFFFPVWKEGFSVCKVFDGHGSPLFFLCDG